MPGWVVELAWVWVDSSWNSSSAEPSSWHKNNIPLAAAGGHSYSTLIVV